MKNFLFKLILKIFGDQIIDYFIEQQMPMYKMDKTDIATLEKLADLYVMPEFKLFIQMQSNKRNFLAQKALTLKFKNDSSVATKLAFLKGQAYDIAHAIKTIKYFNKLYQKTRSKEGKEDNGK